MLRINKVQLLGRAGKDAEVVGNGKIAKVSIAIQDNFKDAQGQWIDRSHWFNIVFIGEAVASKAANISKGDMIYVEGKLVVNSWEDKEGNKRSQVEVNAFSFDFQEKKEAGSTLPPTQHSMPNLDLIAAPSTESFDDDLPFG